MVPAADTHFDLLLSGSALLQCRAKGTLEQYRRTLRWFWRQWVIPVGRLPRTRAEVQKFLDANRSKSQQKQIPTPGHHRALQAMANQFWIPELSGLPVTLSGARVAFKKRLKNAADAADAWTYFVPRYILADHDNFAQYKGVLCSYVGAPKREDVRNVRYAVSILWGILVAMDGVTTIPSEVGTEVLMGAIVKRGHQSLRGNVDRVLVETTRIANRFLLVCGLSWQLPLAQVRAAYHASLNCNHLITINTSHTEMKKRCTRLVSRHSFNDSEVSQLINHASTLRDRCVFVVLARTGLRRRALAWMQLAAVWDGSQVRSEGYTLEKGMRLRMFTIDSDMAQCLRQFIMHERPWGRQSRWLFPSPHNPAAHIQPGTLQLRLKQHCSRLGIVGSQVRLHGLRKYTVGTLLQAGNSIESVSEWIGHRGVDTTYATYWDTSVQDISTHMSIPWLAN